MNANASSLDFQHAMEAASGQDLGAFFAQWLHRPGIPKLDGTWTWDATAKQVRVTVRQTVTDGGPFRFPLDVGVIGTAGTAPRVTTVEVTGETLTATIPSDAAPSDVVLDPDTWLLFERGPVRAWGPGRAWGPWGPGGQ
ncbi:MAG: hypothetical protein R2752_06910 [Vicinamibacterales bacterium]